MIRTSITLLTAGLLSVSTQACAQGGNQTAPDKWLNQSHAPAFAASVDLRINDQVRDGCWAAPDTAEREAADVFTGNGIVVEYAAIPTIQHPAVHIEAAGYRTSGGLCVGSIRFHVNYNILSEFDLPAENVNFVHYAESYSRVAVTDDPANLDADFQSFVEASAEEFVSRIYRARQSEELDGVFTD